MTISELTKVNFNYNAITTFLSNYTIENFYLKSLKIDFEEFITFKTNIIKSKIDQGNALWQVEHDGKLMALFGLKKNETRSTNFGINYYEFNPLYNFSPHASDCLRLFEEQVLKKQIKTKNIEYIKTRINATDHYNIAAFSKQSYTFIGTSLNLHLKNDDYKVKEFDRLNYKIEAYTNKYKEVIRELIDSHGKNEDFYDIEIEKSKTKNNFYSWFEKHNKNKNTVTLVLRDLTKNTIVGFTCYSKEMSFSSTFNLNLITRDLTIISNEYYGQGLASLLFSEIMKREKKNVELKLLSNNYSAIRFNHFNGFKIVSSHHYFSKKI